MVVRYKNKDGTGGILVPPFDARRAALGSSPQPGRPRRTLCQGWPPKRWSCSDEPID
jgi:hypothetical protein